MPSMSSDLSLPVELQPPANNSQGDFNFHTSLLTDYSTTNSSKMAWNTNADSGAHDDAGFNLDYVEQGHDDEDISSDLDVWDPEGEHDVGQSGWKYTMHATHSGFDSSAQHTATAHSEPPPTSTRHTMATLNSVSCPGSSASQSTTLPTDQGLDALPTNKCRGVDIYNDLRAKRKRQMVANSNQTASPAASSSSSLLAVPLSLRSRSLSVSLPENVSSTKPPPLPSLNPPTSPAISSVPSHWSNNSFPSRPESSVQHSLSEQHGDSHLLSSASPETKAFIMAADISYKQFLLIHHMFPEVVSKSHEFACLTFDEAQTTILKNIWSRIAAAGEAASSRVTANLAKNANFVFEKVGIATSGDIIMTPSGKPMRTGQFKHACVEKAILHIAFRDKQAAVATAPRAFCPVPLTLIVFSCVVIHYALEVKTLPNGTARPQLDCKTYNVHYTTYTDSLNFFGILATISNDVSFDESLSEEEFERLIAASMSGSQVGMVAAAAQPEVAQQG
ncbi:hypothetical protein K439DRAFT_1612212 [Ramaria rubella]|nr:hypothetical protein K439DRAFT_1612212 [Ramaria rubella]